MPSSSRSLASRDGRCFRDRNGGRMRICHGTRCELCLPASPSGPIERAVTNAERWSPRRTGRSEVSTRICWPAGISSAWVRGSARALGGQASRTWPRNRRRPAFSIVSSALTTSPSRAAVAPDRVNWSGRVLAANDTSTTTAATNRASNTANAVAGQGDSAIGRTQISATSPVRPVRTTIAAPERSSGCRRARHRDWHPPARPPAAAPPGAGVWDGPSP